MPDEARIPLSAAQRGIWTGQQLDPDSPAFNTAEYVEILGPVRVAEFVAAVRRTVGETEALGVRFIEDDDGPAQLLGQAPDWTMQVADVSAHADPLAAVREWMAEDLARPLDFTRDPTFGHALFALAPDRFLWYHRVHHIALDGYGLGLVARRVAEVYTALVEGREPVGCTFGSLRAVVEEDLAYQASERYHRDRDYWVADAEDRPEPVTLAGRSGPLSRGVLRCQDFLDQSTVDSLAAAARAVKATWTDALTAAFAAYLHRMSGAGEVNIALPIMSRMGSVSLRVPCMVLNVVAVHVPVGRSASLSELTGRLADEVRRARPHHRYRYEQLRRDLKLVTSDRKLFGPSVNIMPFDYGLRFAGHPGVVRNVSAGLVEDMVVNVYDRADGSGLHITFDANPACYTLDELTVHLRRFLGFLENLAAHPTRPVGEAQLLLEDERRGQLEWNDNARDVAEETVPDLWEAQVARTPDATALVAGEVALSFGELNARANRLARYLVAHGAGPERSVALLLPRTAEAIVALLAVLKAGAAYVPIDPDYPDARVVFMLEDAGPVLTRTSAPPTDHPDHDLTDGDRLGPLTPATPLALIYTSGSTGIPKGAVLEHRGMVNLFHHHREHLIGPEVEAAGGRRWMCALTASLSFDTSWEGLLWMLAGHELHFIDDDTRREPEELLRYIDRERIDFLDITPTYAEELVAAGLLTGEHQVPAVIALGGEAVGPALWTALRATPGLSTYNLYGPTECTVDTLWCRLADSETPIVGRPVANSRAYVLDGALRLLPPGAVGELYLAGTPLGRGYHNRAELTAQRFLPDPFGPPDARMYRTGDLARWRADGNLEFLGRADDQVKVRGFRIELGEIESVLSGHSDLAQVAVGVWRDRLVAYVVPLAGRSCPEPAVLRRFLAERLPDYLVPPAFVALDRLPVNANGKLDRGALPAPDASAHVAGRPPRTARERELCVMFAEILELPEVGIDDDFFTLGGHSLLVARLLARIRSAFDVRLGIRAVFEAPTVAALAEQLGGDSSDNWTAINFANESALDSEITGAGLPPADPERSLEPRRILLTGATGFLGAFLLGALLEHTGAEIYCLVRAADDTEAAHRLRSTLRRYRLWDDALAGRSVVAVAGDLAEPDLGVGAKRFAELAEDIDVIYHNGARVNHLEPYARLRPANVFGTQEILRLATSTRLKPVHHVSTCEFADLSNGYVASKWVAEELVRAAGDRGVPVAVYRPSRVCGHSVSGVGGTDDAFWNLIRAMIIVGAAPRGEQTADLVAADYVADAITHLSRQPDSIGKTFHLTSPRPIPVRTIVDQLRQRGYELAGVSHDEWTRRLTARVEAGDYALSLVATHAGAGAPTAVFDQSNTRAGLAGTPIGLLVVDEQIIARYLNYFVESGFFPAPSGVGR